MATDLEWLKEADEGQRWVWLAGRLNRLEEHQTEDYTRINRHDKALNAIEQRCAERRWQGRLLWCTLVAVIAMMADRVAAAIRGH